MLVVSASFFVKRLAMSCARNVPCDRVTGDESLHTNDNVTLLHRRDYMLSSICCRNKLATWFKHDLVLLPWKGVRIIVVCGVLSARKPIASRDRGNVYLIYHEQCISRLYCRPIYYTFQIPLPIQMYRRLWRIVNGKYKNVDGDLLRLRD